MNYKNKNQNICSSGTDIFEKLFERGYELIPHGEKKRLHLAMKNIAQPPLADSTSRKYCDLKNVSFNKRTFFLPRILAALANELKHISKESIEYANTCSNTSEEIIHFLKTLKNE